MISGFQVASTYIFSRSLVSHPFAYFTSKGALCLSRYVMISFTLRFTLEDMEVIP
ncbi:hypothetical protein [Leptospira noguchii]|uniref:hypothetical protein n=1 Tax=Leptospira noguchii TaxID=28182 RepID=UPI0002D75FEF|nr:hypothetical protein [Leptospira noguchii]